MSTVADVLRKKGVNVLTVEESATVYQAIQVMDEHRVGAMVVMDGLRVSGIFTERDYMRRILLQGRTSRTTLVGEAMTTDLITVGPGESVEACMALMTEHRIRHLPVMKEDHLVGILSIGDIVKTISEEAQARADHLQGMISGSYPA